MEQHLLKVLMVAAMAAGSCVKSDAADAVSRKPPPPAGTYINPLGDPLIHMADPFLLLNAKKYYLIGTSSPGEGFSCYESTDLVHWKSDGWAWRKSRLRVANGNLRAPQIFSYQGTFYLVYSAQMSEGIQLGLAASLKPEGPYHDFHVPWLVLGDGCVDGDVFVDDDDKPYLVYSRRTLEQGCSYAAIFGVALSQDLSQMVGQPVKLLEASQPWELVQREANRSNDGGRVFKRRGRYYLTYSANDRLSPDRGIGYATANKPLGPWTKSAENPLVSSHPDIGVSGPGHNSIIRSPDRNEWFIVYHSFAEPKNPIEDCVVNLDRLLFLSNGKFAVKGPSRTPQPLPSGLK